MQPAALYPPARAARQNLRFAKVLAVVLPGSLLITLAWKQLDDAPFYVAPPQSERETPLRRFEYAAPYLRAQARVRCVESERRALTAIGIALGGGVQLARWADDDTACCSWPGVTCGRDGHVAKLSLPHGGANGTLPSQLCELRDLAELDLNDNRGLGGTLPSQLGSLSRLSHVYLFGSHVSGTLPPSVGRCAALQELELSHSRLSGTLPRSLPPALRYVFLGANAISGTVPSGALAPLHRLKELELADNRLSGSVPTQLYARHLEHFDAARNAHLRLARDADAALASGRARRPNCRNPPDGAAPTSPAAASAASSDDGVRREGTSAASASAGYQEPARAAPGGANAGARAPGRGRPVGP